ncbi:MAG TPA: hypothetical protein VFS67_18770 [Polyangiaceae bacterium]|nr:hypothetical protein [Polyangiaceae bacterium]
MRSRWPRAALPVLGASVLGCGAQFDPGSELHGLRVLALKKSAPYAQPGTRVDLQLLWHDTEPDRPPPQIAWLAACQNPPGDLFDACFATAPQAGGGDLIEQLRTRSSLPDPSSAQANDHFSFETSPDIISSRPPPKDPTTVPYGLDYVLFAVCAGTLDLRLDRDFPFVCYLEQDGEPGLSSGDAELGSSDFIVGYTSVFAYDAIENQNPLVYGLRWGELELRPGELPMMAGEPLAAAALGADDLCIGAACQPAPASAEPGVCPEALTIDACPGSSPCDKLRFGPIVDPASAELDTAASALRSTELQEQMWVNYYASDGELSQEVKLLNDATQGWNEESDTEFRAGKEAGVTYLWSVAHDNRGGAEWARLRVCTR